jgi:hypothetical protein
MHDIVTGAKTAEEARQYYTNEFVDYRRKKPTPYMQGLRYKPGDAGAADPDERAVSDRELERAVEEGKRNG